ncbi:hypothetical protein [Streptomyces sp. BH105]|uniref:hypothetical protein n=1 Tax=Streptomyces sp. BH105 TaxID=3410408 RepID=UPI003CF20142
MSDETPVPTEKVTIRFSGKITVDASLMNSVGKVRTTEDVVREVVAGIETEIKDHLMYDDEDREPFDLVQEVEELNVWDATASTEHAAALALKIKQWEAVDAEWVDVRSEFRDENGDETDPEALDKLIAETYFQKFWDASDEVKAAVERLLLALAPTGKPAN